MEKGKLAIVSALMLLAFGFAACTESATKAPPKKSAFDMVAKAWKIKKFTIKSDSPMGSPGALGSASFTFFRDGHYEIVFGDFDKGKWQLGPDNKTLVTTSEVTMVPGEIDVEYLSDTLLILFNEQAVPPVRFELVPE